MGNFNLKSIWKQTGGTGGSTNLEQRVQTLENDTVKLSGAQNISGVKTITATTEALQFKPGTNSSAYVSFYNGNTRIAHFGKGSSSSNNLIIGTSSADIKLEPNGKVDLSNKKISFLAEPTAVQDAANKQYVDNRIKTRTLTQTINTSSSFTVAPTQGYQIINVMIGRKRTSDNYFFFTYHETLNFQFYVNSSNNFILWNQGNVNGFNNEYKIIITEMKA